MRTRIAALSVVLLIAAGCGYEPAPVPPAKQVASQQPAAKPGPAPNPGISSPAEGQSGLTGGMRAAGNAIGLAPLDMMGGGSSGGSPAQPPQKAPPVKPAATYSKAQAGVGAQGQGYGGGIITEPVRQYFRMRESINFLMYDKAMNEFKILNERLPKDQQEFDKLMSEYGVQLPRLNPGERYVYDPKAGELKVEHPAP
jgi:hypothetical protein